LIGQELVKGVVGSAFQNGTLGHAYLFCGERGTGKFAAAVDLAMALLCRGAEARPCGVCPSCRKAATYSHPDLHVIMPLVLQADHKASGGALSDEGWQFAAELTKGRIDDPYRLPQYAGIPNIPVDWVREADHAIQRGATEGAFNVAIIDGVDTMGKEAANAMLKTLEEPPPGTVMILLTDKPHAVLPTIVSRCQLIRFALLPPDVVSAELYRRFRTDKDAKKEVDETDLFAGIAAESVADDKPPPDPRIEAAAACGSIGIAIEEFEDPREEYFEFASSLWSDCRRGDWESAARSADRLAASDDALGSCRKTVQCLAHLLRHAFLRKFGAPVNYINVGERRLIELPETSVPGDVERFVGLCQGALDALDARGNCTLVAVNFVCSLMEMLNAEEQ